MQQPPLYPPNTNLGALVTLTAASASVTSAQQTNSLYHGVTVGINVTAISGTSASLTVTIQGVDPVSGTTFTLLASAAITATGYHTLTLFPGITATANVSANTVLPLYWQVSCAIAGTTPSVTATVSANYQS
jgi:hypothetical protein